MKVYIGDKSIVLAKPEEDDEQSGFVVVDSDGSEYFVPRETFNNDYREVTEEEFDLMISTVAEELSDEDLKELFETETPQEGEVDISDTDVPRDDYAVEESEG